MSDRNKIADRILVGAGRPEPRPPWLDTRMPEGGVDGSEVAPPRLAPFRPSGDETPGIGGDLPRYYGNYRGLDRLTPHEPDFAERVGDYAAAMARALPGHIDPHRTARGAEAVGRVGVEAAKLTPPGMVYGLANSLAGGHYLDAITDAAMLAPTVGPTMRAVDTAGQHAMARALNHYYPGEATTTMMDPRLMRGLADANQPVMGRVSFGPFANTNPSPMAERMAELNSMFRQSKRPLPPGMQERYEHLYDSALAMTANNEQLKPLMQLLKYPDPRGVEYMMTEGGWKRFEDAYKAILGENITLGPGPKLGPKLDK